MGLTLLTPDAGLVAAAVALPLAGLSVAWSRAEQARATLELPPAPAGPRRPLLLALAFAALGVAAAQPAVERERTREVRTDAEAIVVLDTSRSMAARPSPTGTTRLERAKTIARDIRARLADVPTGVATLTDRMLPHLLPTADAAAFDATVGKAIGIERPAARDRAVQATQLGALGEVVSGRYFTPRSRRRLLVVVTDGDSAPFDAGRLARTLAAARIRLELVRVGDESERVYGPAGTPEPGYRPSPAGGSTLVFLAETAGGVALDDGGEAAQAAEDVLGRGPTTVEGVATEVTSLAALFAAAALVPIALLLADGVPRLRTTLRRQ